jgi:lambda family phage portal protein
MAKRIALLDRMLKAAGLPMRASSSGYPAYQGAGLTRLNSDWIGSLLSSDQEIRTSQKRLRARCRQLYNNNDYAQRFVSVIQQNVVGANGIHLEAQVASESDDLATETNEEIERVWEDWCRLGNCTVDGEMSFLDVLNLAVSTLVVEGECFLRKVRGFSGNKFNFALQFIDPDQIDVQHNSARQVGPDGKVQQNEIRMGVEVDQWNRRVAYWLYEGHPSEGKMRRVRIPASEMVHVFLFRRSGQTRGVPWMHTAMTRLNMLGGYEEAELVAARLGACKMGFIQTEHPDDYAGPINANTGAIEPVMEPGTLEKIPAGMTVNAINWDHPNAGFGEFVKVMLRGASVGLGISYHSFTGDLADVNYSSIRQGVLDERDRFRTLQTFAIDHLCQPIFESFLPVAVAAGEAKLPPAGLEEYLQAIRWQPRGFTWVDPLKDIEAAITARGAGLETLAEICARQGKDWREVIDQIAVEDKYAKDKGVVLNFSRPKAASIGAEPEAVPAPGGPKQPVKQGADEGDGETGEND